MTLRATGGVMRAVAPASPAVALPRILFRQAPGGENVGCPVDAIPGGRGGPDASPPLLPEGLARGETRAPVRGFSAKGIVMGLREEDRAAVRDAEWFDYDGPGRDDAAGLAIVLVVTLSVGLLTIGAGLLAVWCLA